MNFFKKQAKLLRVARFIFEWIIIIVFILPSILHWLIKLLDKFFKELENFIGDTASPINDWFWDTINYREYLKHPEYQKKFPYEFERLQEKFKN